MEDKTKEKKSTLTDVCDNSKKFNRTFIVLSGLLITIVLFCIPMMCDFTPEQLNFISDSRNQWLPVIVGIIGYFFGKESNDL
jgi:uncharacterized integral membrane protein